MIFRKIQAIITIITNEFILITIRHLAIYSKSDIKKIVFNKNAKKIPKATNNIGITPNTPFLLIYFGDIYLT